MSSKVKNTAAAESLATGAAAAKRGRLLYCCLPRGEFYTNQPYNDKARWLEYRSREWIEKNPAVWNFWKKQVYQDVQNQRHWSIAELVEHSRKYDLVNSKGEPMKICNNYKAAFVRILCEEISGAQNFVTLRYSIFERARDERQR